MHRSYLNTQFRQLSATTALVSALALAAPADADPSLYRFETVDVPRAPGTAVAGINAFGAIVGSFGGLHPGDPTPLQGFIRSGNRFDTIDVPHAIDTTAQAINAFGTIVGSFDDSRPHGYIRNINGRFTTVDVPTATLGTSITGINNFGTIVGSFTNATNGHGFVRQRNGQFVTVDVPGAISTDVAGINDFGTLAGFFDTNSGTRGFVRDQHGNFTTIDVPGSGNTDVLGINNLGQIVGVFNASPSNPGEHGFLLSFGRFTEIDVPDAASTDALAVNDFGVIVGSYFDKAGNVHGFIATPFFVGLPGKDDCFGQSVAGLNHTFGGPAGAAAELGFAGIEAMQHAIFEHCGDNVPTS